MLIDEVLSEFDATIDEHIVIDASPDAVYEAARGMDFMQVHSPILDAAMFVRGLPQKLGQRLDDRPPPPPTIMGGEGFVTSSTNPVLLFQAKADYPLIARRSGLEGTVIVKVLVGVSGRVRAAELVQSVHPILDREALAAAARCRFEPAKQRELKVQVWMALPYCFRLR